MKLVDARSGLEIPLPSATAPTLWAKGGEPVIRYPDGESITVLSVEPGYLKARAYLRSVFRDLGTGRLVTQEHWQPLTVRWFHPGFFGQHVAFIPS